VSRILEGPVVRVNHRFLIASNSGGPLAGAIFAPSVSGIQSGQVEVPRCRNSNGGFQRSPCPVRRTVNGSNGSYWDRRRSGSSPPDLTVADRP